MCAEMIRESAMCMSQENDELVEYFEISEEHRLKGMCRVCASSKNKLILVFGGTGKKKGVLDLIHSFLPILVTPEDLLPVSICLACLGILSTMQRLVENCIKADKKMRIMLNEIIEGTSQNMRAGDLVGPVEANEKSVKDALVPMEDKFCNMESVNPNSQSHSGFFDCLQTKPPELGKKSAPSLFEIGSESDSIEHKQQSKSPSDKKLYRCLLCSQTNSDAYLLLLHQIRSHPGNLLKCNECEFICSSDQEHKYNEHIQLHVASEYTEVDSQSMADYALNPPDCAPDTGLSDNKRDDIENASGEVSKTEMQSRLQPPEGVESIQQSKKEIMKKEVHWRCGFCGTKAKSKAGLSDHCSQRHKERMGRSMTHSSDLECSRCKETFSDEMWLKDHLCHNVLAASRPAATSKSMSCLACPETFRDVKAFRDHLLSHTNSVRCKICGAHFRSHINLQSHLEKHEKKPSYECPHCPRIFRLKSRLKIHMRTHTGERPYMCVKCGKRFSTDCGFRLHMSAHEGKKPYVCALCGQTFNRPSNLRRHEEICRRGKKLQCRICHEEFTKRADLLCHRAMHTKEEKETSQALQADSAMMLKEDRFSCKVCNMRFDRVVDLFQHRKESHTMNELEEARKAGKCDGGAHACAECGKELYNKRNYERHLLTHAGNSRFSCMVCPNKYSTKFALDYHMYTHTGERPFKCDLCSDGFKTKIGLRVHRMRHTGEKPFKCRMCSMGFMTAQSLRLHLVSHSDLRMFSCNYCPATFKRKKTLVTHVRIHTGEKPFACQYCGRQFTQKGTCSQHEKSHVDSRNSQPKFLTPLGATENGMHVTIIKDWKEKDSETLCDQDATLEVLVSQGDSVVENDGVQQMVLIEQDCIVDEQEIMEVNEEMVLEATHAIVIEQDGIIPELPISGLKDENSDPQMPVPDE